MIATEMTEDLELRKAFIKYAVKVRALERLAEKVVIAAGAATKNRAISQLLRDGQSVFVKALNGIYEITNHLLLRKPLLPQTRELNSISETRSIAKEPKKESRNSRDG
jgi:hypothetical protein